MLGILLLTFSVLIHLHGSNIYCLKLAQRLTESIGIALIIAYFFTYVISTAKFVEYISKFLEEIIISKDFLSNLKDEHKKEALSSLLKPSESLNKQHTDLERYYDYYITTSMEITQKNTRSNYKIHGEIFYDENRDKVFSDIKYTYRLFPSENGYLPIKAGFSIDDTDSAVKKLSIFDTEGKCEKTAKEEIEFKNTDSMRLYEYSLKHVEADHVDVLLETTEKGESHWFMYKFKALQPTNGFYLDISCREPLIVKDHIIFDFENNYHIEINDTKTAISINCHQWISEGAGVTILFANKNE